MSARTTNYRAEAESDARETVSNFADEILEQLLDKGKASDDLNNDYPNGDSWHHESHVDKWYSLTDAAELIDELSDCEETDNGLWEGQQPKEAISTCAAFTYGNAVYEEWTRLIEKINEEADEIIPEFDERIAQAEWDAHRLEQEADASDNPEEAARLRAQAADSESTIARIEGERKEALRKMIEEHASGD